MADYLKAELNLVLEERFNRSTEYQSVAVLVVFWDNCTDGGYEQEAQQIGQLFSRDLGYPVDYYRIPKNDTCELELDWKINQFLANHRRPETLLIIHYGGHGNPDNDFGQKQESVWCAEPHEDSPFLKWSSIQPKLAMHTSDVLLLLDCCYGAQAARDSQPRRRSPVPPNVELFAACGMGEKTIRPGPHSFTSILMAEFREQLAANRCVAMAIAHKNMASKHSKLGHSAIYFPLESRNGTARLEPMRNHNEPRVEQANEAASLTLQLSIRENDKKAFQEVVGWLKSNPPRTVSKVVIQNLITSATVAYNYVAEDSAQHRSMASFNALPTEAKSEIRGTWNSFTATIVGLARSVTGLDLSTTATPSAESLSETIMQSLDRDLKPLQNTLERSIMALPDLNNKAGLLSAIDDKTLNDLGFADMLRLRFAAHFGSNMTEDLGRAEVNTDKLATDDLFPKLSVEDLPSLGRVLIECRKYDKESVERDGLTHTYSKQSMQKLAQVFATSKPCEFQSLTCLRYFHEQEKGRYGLIFSIPEGSRPFQISLREVISRVTGRYKPTLDERFKIAHKIGKALMKWHLINWVHQGIASHHIVFFYDENLGVDYSNPYLCGFEYSRMSTAPSSSRFVEDFELNVYRHPDRQGIPTQYHRKEHDMYAYGILLLEIGIWKPVRELFSDEEKKSLSPHRMGEKILLASRELLPHSMGLQFENATTACLSGEFGVNQDDALQSRLAATFDAQVLEKIRKGVR